MHDGPKENDHSAIDRIIYLASLASKPREIDSLMEPLRFVTARLKPNTTLSAPDKVTLQKVYEAIKNYLLNSDPLRAFTTEQLNQMLERQFAGRLPMKKRTIGLLIAVWGISVSAAILAYATGTWLPSEEKRNLFGSVVFISAIFISAALFNVLAVKRFRPELRYAYAYICSGIIIAGIASAQFPLIEMIDQLGSHILFRFGGFTTAYVVACGLFLTGAMRFAKLLSIRISPLFMPLLIVASLVAVVATILASHPTLANANRAFFDLPTASLYVCTVMLIATAWVLQKVINQLALHYANAVRWFLFTTLVIGLACAVRATWILVTGDLTSLWSNVLFIVGSVVMLHAGYKFYHAANDR